MPATEWRSIRPRATVESSASGVSWRNAGGSVAGVGQLEAVNPAELTDFAGQRRQGFHFPSAARDGYKIPLKGMVGERDIDGAARNVIAPGIGHFVQLLFDGTEVLRK